MTVLLVAIAGWVGAWFGGTSGDFVCKHQEWTAQHMKEQVGMPLEEGRRLAAAQCRVGDKNIKIDIQ